MSLHLGVAGFAAAADNPYFVMAGFAVITDYFRCRSWCLNTSYFAKSKMAMKKKIDPGGGIYMPP
jgi:hypothetical protein